METYLRGALNIYSPAVTRFLQITLTEQNSDPLYEAVIKSKVPLQKAREKGEIKFLSIIEMLDLNKSDNSVKE